MSFATKKIENVKTSGEAEIQNLSVSNIAI